MKRYKFVARTGENRVILESTDGKIINVSESTFREKFVKLKDRVSDAFKEGWDKIKDLIGKVVNCFTILDNKLAGVYIHLGNDDVKKAHELGVDTQNDEFDEAIERSNENEANSYDFLRSMIYDRISEFYEMFGKKKVNEAIWFSREGDEYDMGPDRKGVKYPIDSIEDTDLGDVYFRGETGDKKTGTIKSPIATERRGRKNPSQSKGRYQAKLESYNKDIVNMNYKELSKMVISDAYNIFKREITKTSALEAGGKETGLYRPLIIWGASGVGKTAIVESIASVFKNVDANGEITVGGLRHDKTGEYKTLIKTTPKEVQIVYVDCANLGLDSINVPLRAHITQVKRDPETGEMISVESDKEIEKGIDKTDNGIKFIPTSIFPSFDYNEALKEEKEGKTTVEERDTNLGYGIIILDEITRAGADMMDKIMNVLQSRHPSDSHVLGTHWMVIATSNRPQDVEAETDNLEEIQNKSKELLIQWASANRFRHVNYVPTREEWIAWAERSGGVCPIVLDYLKLPMNQHRWYNTRIDTDTVAGNPRNWKQFSDALVEFMNNNGLKSLQDVIDMEVINDFCSAVESVVASNLGAEAPSFMEYIESEVKYLSVEDFKAFWNSKGGINKTNDSIKQKTGKNYGFSGVGSFVRHLINSCPVEGSSLKTQDDLDKFLEADDRYEEFGNMFNSVRLFFGRNMVKHVAKEIVRYYQERIKKLCSNKISDSVIEGIITGTVPSVTINGKDYEFDNSVTFYCAQKYESVKPQN